MWKIEINAVNILKLSKDIFKFAFKICWYPCNLVSSPQQSIEVLDYMAMAPILAA